ncbi:MULTISPECIES: hypothetical protein [Bacillus]|uniref:Uncharacterized protein n=2 Tax=Bacillus cereus group TaxID=86661 RepID=A0A0G8CHP8_9BACI|nr:MULTISPECIES: hypothetical protein [Bacillus cereus group]KKZ99322.1 hypothetical protein B4147_3906 [Bacillus wiedmannii]KPU58397.1 hypothetical protein AN402_5135 [Bacillus wiedmannii]MED2838125.1 hypothetical protein [Bacillus wiedmannii]
MTAIAIGYKIMSVKGFYRNYHSPAGDKMKVFIKGWNKHSFIHT